ncbi:MAG: tyrosine-type recombinase/integrase [Gammaproteobacteria bacterium]|nr:tyrosine-type recombinase/integrase [Gammaproteobacteria bacterium]
MTFGSMPHARPGDPIPPIRERGGLRPLLLVFVRGVARRLERNPRGVARTLACLDIGLAIGQLHTAALAATTRKAYAGALRRFDDWLGGRPPTDRFLARHLDEMFRRGLAPASAALVVAALRRAVRDLNRAGRPCHEHPVGPVTVERLERYRREAADRGRGQAAPLLWEDADRMSECAETLGGLRGVRDAALVGVASHAMLRVSEVSRLDADDVSPQPDGSALLKIRRSKTDQYGEGAVLHVCRDAAGRLERWMATAGIESGPLFRPVKGAAIQAARLGTGAVRAAIKRRAAEAGVARRVSGHSLRVGAAQSLAERGVSLAELQVIGRWTSPAMPGRYVRGQKASRGAVARLRGNRTKICKNRLQSEKW